MSRAPVAIPGEFSFRHMKSLLKLAVVVLLAGAGLTGCGKKAEAPPPIEKKTAQAVSVVGDSDPAAPAPTLPQAQTPPPPQAEPAQEHPAVSKSPFHYRLNTAAPFEAQLQMLTDALNVYEDWNGGKSPTSLQQLVEKKAIDRLPTPPPGKKFVIDSTKHVVSLESQ